MPDLSKVPPWVWALSAVGIGAGVYLYKKSKESSSSVESSSETGTETVPEVVQEPYPYSYGGGESGGVGGGAIGTASESPFSELFGQLLQSQRDQSTAQQEHERSISQSILESERQVTEILRGNAGGSPGSAVNTGSGGGAPSSGTGTVQQPPSQHPASCPSGFPHQNGGVASSNTCYKTVSKSMSGPKGAKVSCQCHEYQNGHNECQHVVNGHCVW